MKKESISTAFPFTNDPLTNKTKPWDNLGRETEARGNLALMGNLMFTKQDIDGVNRHINDPFKGELEDYSINMKNRNKIKPIKVVLYDGREKTYQNKTMFFVLKDIEKRKLPYRMILQSNKKIVKESSSDGDIFISQITNILPSCFKIESESYKHNVKETGSCFYIKENILITCAHVISRNKETDLSQVSTFVIDNGKRYYSKVLDIDYELDIAILYCDAVRHVPLKYKSIDEMEVGSEVVCVGSPYGYDNNVTKGILSSKGRDIKNKKGKHFFVDLSVFPGSSGGPIIDTKDESVFGIAAMIIESVANYGLNTGIPIDFCIKRFENVLKQED